MTTTGFSLSTNFLKYSDSRPVSSGSIGRVETGAEDGRRGLPDGLPRPGPRFGPPGPLLLFGRDWFLDLFGPPPPGRDPKRGLLKLAMRPLENSMIEFFIVEKIRIRQLLSNSV